MEEFGVKNELGFVCSEVLSIFFLPTLALCLAIRPPN